MNIWTTVLLAWVSVNLFLVALMWRYQAMKERSARQRAAAQAPASTTDAAPQPCARAASGWVCRPPAAAPTDRNLGNNTVPRRHRVVSLTSADTAATAWRGATASAVATDATPTSTSRHVQELRDEIRVLKLTVAELALEKAMLSAAVSRRKALP